MPQFRITEKTTWLGAGHTCTCTMIEKKWLFWWFPIWNYSAREPKCFGDVRGAQAYIDHWAERDGKKVVIKHINTK